MVKHAKAINILKTVFPKVIFEPLKRCDSCFKSKICVFCYKEIEICKECDAELMEYYNEMEKGMNKYNDVDDVDNVEEPKYQLL